MSDYTKTVDFAAKDALASGNAAKAAKGTEVDTEFNNIATAVNTKYDVADRDIANGICPLDAGTLVPVANLPVATTTAIGALEVATAAESTALTLNTRTITPLRFNEAAIAFNLLLEGNLSWLHNLTDPGFDVLYGWDDSATNSAPFTLGTGLAFNASPGIELDFLGLEDLTDPGADRLTGWDDTAGFLIFWNINNGISFNNGASTLGLTDAAASTTNPIDISSGTIQLDMTTLTSVDASGIDGADVMVINDGANKSLAYQDFGIPQTDDTNTTPFSGATLAFANRWYNLNNAAAISVVIPANVSIAYPIGTTFAFHQRGAGQITVTVTTDDLRAPAGAATTQQYSTMFATKIGTTEWTMTGDTV
jgi:hypothetical protein